MHIVLVEPEIPPNTGNVARLAAATNSVLHLIKPYGFRLDNRELKRAGMDYWKYVSLKEWDSWKQFEEHLTPQATLWYIESGGPKRYTDIKYSKDDYLVFGRESAGLPLSLLEKNPERWIRIPMFNPHARSINLSNCVAIVLYEALRQLGFPQEVFDGKYAHS